MITTEQTEEITQTVNVSLDNAEATWGKVGHQLIKVANERAYNFSMESVDSQIPGYPSVEMNDPQVDDFIALVADMRNSTNHLMCAISSKHADVSQLQRVFYETAALLPALAQSISFEKGSVTEYLGDGVLGLFCMKDRAKEDVIYAANRAGKKCLSAVGKVVNPILKERYSLPPLDIGVGLAYSKAVVTLVGLPEFMQPKVFGECVFRATKLSFGTNTIIVDEAIKLMWPSTKNGKIRFQKKNKNGLDGYEIQKT